MFEEDIGFGDDDDFDFVFVFDADEFLAFAVIEVVAYAVMDFDDDAPDGFSGGGREYQSHDFDGQAFCGFDLADAIAGWAVFVDASAEGGSDALSGHFDEPEGADAEYACASAVASDGVSESVFDAASVLFFAHVDEVIDDYATEVAESDLACDGICCAKVHLVGALFGVGISPEAAAVDVDGNECFGLVDNE